MNTNQDQAATSGLHKSDKLGKMPIKVSSLSHFAASQLSFKLLCKSLHYCELLISCKVSSGLRVAPFETADLNSCAYSVINKPGNLRTRDSRCVLDMGD